MSTSGTARATAATTAAEVSEYTVTAPFLGDGLGNAVAHLAGLRVAPEIDHDHVGPGYGVADARAMDALRLAARTEGLLLDPVYTAKAMAALVTWSREGRLTTAASVCFWHTGGQPALFAPKCMGPL